MYAPVAKSAGFVSRTRLTLKTSLEPVLRKFRRYSSRGTAGLRFGLVGTIMYTPCAESAPFASDERLTLKTSVYSAFWKLRRYSSCHTLSGCVFFGSCTFKYTPFQKASRFASGKRLTLQTSLGPVLRKFKHYSSREEVLRGQGFDEWRILSPADVRPLPFCRKGSGRR